MLSVLIAILLQGAPDAKAAEPETPQTKDAQETSKVIAAEWASTPTPEDIARAYPGAGGLVSAGSATLACKVTGDGGLSGCEVVSEYPHYVGFGSAALKLAPRYKVNMTPKDKAPPPAGAMVQVDVEFPHR